MTRALPVRSSTDGLTATTHAARRAAAHDAPAPAKLIARVLVVQTVGTEPDPIAVLQGRIIARASSVLEDE